jgi:hypothetical protein
MPPVLTVPLTFWQSSMSLGFCPLKPPGSLAQFGQGGALDADIPVGVEGGDKDTAQDLVAQAHQICPYSNAVRDNIEIKPTAEVTEDRR